MNDKKQLRKRLKKEKMLRKARRDINIFTELTLLDTKTGRPVEQAEIHKIWQKHIEWCWDNGYLPGILAPWGHGKSSQMISRILFEIGQNQNIRIKIVSNSEDTASDRISAIKRYLGESKFYDQCFPKVKPNKNRWGAKRLSVKRDSPSPDPTIDAHGVLSTGIGGRADFILFDDVVDRRNAIQEPKKQKQVIESFDDVWMSRLDPPARVIYIATRWTMSDLTSKLLKSSAWCWLVQSVSKDLGYIEEEKRIGDNVIEKTKRGLWAPRWSKERLEKKRAETPHQSFERGYRQRPFSDEDKLFPPPAIIEATHNNFSLDEVRERRQGPVFTGVDLASTKRPGTAFFSFKAERRGNRYIKMPIDVRVGEYKGEALIEQFLDIENKYKPQLFTVENNSLQERVIDLLSITKVGNLSIWPYYTGKQKVDVDVGLPSLAVEFQNSLWEIPWKGMGRDKQPPDAHGPSCNCAWCRWYYDEVCVYPLAETSDILMAMWLAREGFREMFGDIEYFEYVESPSTRGVFNW